MPWTQVHTYFRILVLALPVFLAACGGSEEAGSEGRVGSDAPDDAVTPDALAPPDFNVPVDLSRLSVRPPENPVSQPAIQGLATNSGIVELGVTNDNTVGFVGQSPVGHSVELFLDGEFIGSTMGRSDGTWVFDYQAVPLGEGAHELSVASVMDNGERVEGDEAFSFAYVPGAMPAPQILGILPDTGVSDSDGVTSATGIEILGTATRNLPVVIYLDGSAVGSADADTEGNWVFDYRSVALDDGVHQFSAITEYEDEASATSGAFFATVDTGASPPTSLSFSPDSGAAGDGITDTGELQFAGSSEAGSLVEVFADGNSLGVVSADAGGNWSLDVTGTPLAAGSYSITARSTDRAGNTSAASTVLALLVDDAAPADEDVIDTPGPLSGARMGASIAQVGDFNGDGFEDYVVGVPGTTNGTAYLIWGKAGSTSPVPVINADGTIDPSVGFRVVGDAEGDRLGQGVGGAGDLNGDGYDDLLVVAPGNDRAGTDAGAAYVIWGGPGSTRSDLFVNSYDHGASGTNSDLMVVVPQEPGGRLGDGSSLAPTNGQVLASGGDFNGDGIHDLVLGHPQSDLSGTDAGRAYLIFGRRGDSRQNIELENLGADGLVLYAGGMTGWSLGQAVEFVGDFNGDGYDDLVIGAPGSDNVASNGGQVQLVFGRPDPANSIDVAAMAGADGFTVSTSVPGALLGHSLAGGDFNGDGRSDLLVSAHGVGTAYVIYGYDSPDYAALDVDVMSTADGYPVTSPTGSDGLGHALASAGDFNADGVDDLLLGAYLSDAGGAGSGTAWVIPGVPGSARSGIDLGSLATGEGIRIPGDQGDRLGMSLGHGDLNGDGYSDVFVGAPFSDSGSTDSGAVSVMLGRAYGVDPVDGLTGNPGDDVIVGTAGADTAIGGGGADRVSLGAGVDIALMDSFDFTRLDGGRSLDVLAAGTGPLSLTLDTRQPERIRGIEMLDLGDLGNRLTVSRLGLLSLSREGRRLYVTGGNSDVVGTESGEVWSPGGSDTLDGIQYNIYGSGGAELYVDQRVTQTGIGTFSGSQRYDFDTTASGADVSGDVTDFPVLIRIRDPAIIDAVRRGAPDIRFVDADGVTSLDYEIERWDQSADRAEIWVRVPRVYGDTDGGSGTSCQAAGVATGRCNHFTLHYDDNGAGVADGQAPGKVWSRFSGVWHLNEASAFADADDATDFENEAVLQPGALGIRTEGMVGPARDFDAQDAMRAAYNSSFDTTDEGFTITAWIEEPTQLFCLGAPRILMSRGESGRFWYVRGKQVNPMTLCAVVQNPVYNFGNGTEERSVSLGSSFSPIGSSFGEWVQITIVYNPGAGTRIYSNGELVDADTAAPFETEGGKDLIFGANNTAFDEVRLGRFPMSADEIKLMFSNQSPVSVQTLVSPGS